MLAVSLEAPYRRVTLSLFLTRLPSKMIVAAKGSPIECKSQYQFSPRRP
jgi:hypothetical protein